MCSAEDTSFPKKKILVIDDDTDFTEFCQMVLEKNGYETIVAHSGEDGRKLASSERPDLILLDMMMETWSEGSNVVIALRASVETKDTPIILVSSVNFRNTMADEAPEEAMEVDGYIVKPVEPQKLLEQVKSTLKA